MGRLGAEALLLASALAVVAILAAAAQARSGRHSPRAHAAIVGGSTISVERAPWQAEIEVKMGPAGERTQLCGASIISAREVLTAAFCVYDQSTREKVPATAVTVLTGTSDYKTPSTQLAVSKVHVHPYYVYGGEPPEQDDVAVLTLASPLTFSTTVGAITLAAPASQPGEGTHVDLTGFGAEQPRTEPDGALHSIAMSLLFPKTCPGVGAANALFLCGSTPSGALCGGDAGSGLTVPGPPVELVGVVSDETLTAEGGECVAGSLGVFANLTAPEVGDFVESDEGPMPPRAPQGEHAEIAGVLLVGRQLSCSPGAWTNDPTFTYIFADNTSGTVLQSGASSVYTTTPGDVGRSIRCEVHATNAGGTGVGRTSGLNPIEKAPPTPPPPQPAAAVELSKLTLAANSIRVSLTGVAAVKLICRGQSPCRGRVAITVKRTVGHGRARRLRNLSIGTASFTIPSGSTATVRVKLSAAGRGALRAARHRRLSARLELLGVQSEPIKAQAVAVELLLHR